MSVKPKRVGLFGGTFDPVHNGHISIAKSFLESNTIDELWVLLNPAPPHKPDEDFAPFAIRLKMLKSAFKPYGQAIVSDLEQHLPQPTYTVQTLAHLTDKYPDYPFYLCIGKDSYINFKSWHKWDEILDYCLLLVADRSIADSGQNVSDVSNSAIFVEHTPVDVSSTEIRKRITMGKPVDHLVPSSVAAIIKTAHLYTK